MTREQRQQGGGESRYAGSSGLSDLRRRLLELHGELERSRQRADAVADAGHRPEDVAVILAMQSGVEEKLGQIRAALARIEAGTYGACADCGEAIHPARLEARPFAPRCVACQQWADRQGGSRDLWRGTVSQWLVGQ